jgi:hypothetical protein
VPPGVHSKPRLGHTLIVQHERAGVLVKHRLDAAFPARLVADAKPPATGLVRRLVFPCGLDGLDALLIVPERIDELWGFETLGTCRYGPWFAAVADVVPEGMLAIVADDGGEAVEGAGVGVGCWRWGSGAGVGWWGSGDGDGGDG